MASESHPTKGSVICVCNHLFACLFACLLVILFLRRPWSGNGGGISFPSKVIEGFPYAPGRQKHGGLDLLFGVFLFCLSVCSHACSLRDVGRRGSVAYMSMHASPMYIRPVSTGGIPLDITINQQSINSVQGRTQCNALHTSTAHSAIPIAPIAPAYDAQRCRTIHGA